MSVLTLDQIKAVQDQDVVEVDVPEWGGKIALMGLSSVERDEWESTVTNNGRRQQPDLQNFRARLVARCLYDTDESKRMYEVNEMKPDALAKIIGGKSGKVLNRLFTIAARESGVTEGELEEIEKKYVTGQS
jgi:hypothetical protein